MKKVILSAFTAFMLLSVFPAHATADAAPIPLAVTTPAVNESTEAQAMLARLNEIKAMDLKSLSAAERKQLRTEVKAMKSEVKASSDGVYLSIGAIIIIALLLILLL